MAERDFLRWAIGRSGARGTAFAVMTLMVILEDFTAFAVGCDGPNGRVACCPECGRNGVPLEEPDGIFYVHTQASEVLSDGMLTEPRDCCRVNRAAG